MPTLEVRSRGSGFHFRAWGSTWRKFKVYCGVWGVFREAHFSTQWSCIQCLNAEACRNSTLNPKPWKDSSKGFRRACLGDTEPGPFGKPTDSLFYLGSELHSRDPSELPARRIPLAIIPDQIYPKGPRTQIIGF